MLCFSRISVCVLLLWGGLLNSLVRTAHAETHYLGEIRMFAGDTVPAGWAKCDGQVLEIQDHEGLALLLGNTYGGDGVGTFAVPDLRGRLPLHAGQGPELPLYKRGVNGGRETLVCKRRNPNDKSSSDVFPFTFPCATKIEDSAGREVIKLPHSFQSDSLPPALPVNFIIALGGYWPSDDTNVDSTIGEIRMLARSGIQNGTAPRGWANCDGQAMTINQNNALYAILGDQYGGDRVRYFKLPDLRSRIPMHTGDGPGLASRPLAKSGGEYYIAATADMTADVRLKGDGSETNDFAFDLRQRHPKIPPFQAIQFIISLNGIYPTRDGPSRLDPVVGEIRMYAHDNVPSDLARCDGQEMQIQDNADLYKVIGTTYGGAGNTFLAPDLRGRFPMHAGQGPGLTVRKLGVPLGSESVTPKVLEEVSVFGKLDGDDPADLENYPLTYTESNMPPFLTINFAICIKGQLPETELPPP